MFFGPPFQSFCFASLLVNHHLLLFLITNPFTSYLFKIIFSLSSPRIQSHTCNDKRHHHLPVTINPFIIHLILVITKSPGGCPSFAIDLQNPESSVESRRPRFGLRIYVPASCSGLSVFQFMSYCLLLLSFCCSLFPLPCLPACLSACVPVRYYSLSL